MAEGGKNPDEPPLKREKYHGEIEEQERSPDILQAQVNVIGPQNSTIETSNVVGAALDGARVGTTSAGPGRTTEKGKTSDEPPLEKLRTLGLDEAIKDSLPGKINVTAYGPKNSTLTNSTVIGLNLVKCQHDNQRKLLDSTKQKILIRTNEMIRVSAVDSMREKLKHGNTWITITGNAGDGKTTLAHFVLKEFADNMNVYVIKTPEEYDHISQIEEDRVILLNDIFGAFTFDSSSVNKWRDVVADIFDIQMNKAKGVTKVVFVSRHNILQEAKVHLEKYRENITDETKLFDLNQMNTENERLQILDYHLHKKGIKVDDRVKQRVAKMNTIHGFPNCCKMYAELVSRKQDMTIVAFFETPLKFLDRTTELLFETGYRELFINLVKSDGKLSTDSVEDDEKRWKLEKQAKHQEGSYLANFDGIWVFRHSSIYESVLSVVADKDPLLLVNNASMSVIMQKVRFRTSRIETPTCFILLDPRTSVLDALAERFLEQLKEGDYCIFELTIGKNEDFIGSLINKLSSLDGVEKEFKQDILKTNTQLKKQSSSNLINKEDWRGYALLRYAIKNSNYPAVRALLDHGADPNICKMFGRTCLTTVCDRRSGRQSVVNMGMLRLLINYRANVNHIGEQGMTPLHYLCLSREVSVEALQLLLNSGANVNHIDSYGKTPLHNLCRRREVSVETLQVLLNDEAYTNHNDSYGMTHNLCERKELTVEALQLLINSETNVNHIDSKGKTSLHNLCAHEEVSVEALQLLINNEADINQNDSLGMTPLHSLCEHEGVSVEALQLLLNSGADVNHIDVKGRTPLHHMCESKEVNVKALQFLFIRKADVNLCDESGLTPLHSMCKNPNISVKSVQLLIKMGAGINNVEKQGRTPLHVLCTSHNHVFVYFNFYSDECLKRVSEYHAVMDTLIRNGSDVNKPDDAGNTALHSLCDISDSPHIYSLMQHHEYLLGALKALIKAGADVNVQNQKGETPVQMLRKNNPDYTEAIKLLTN